MLYAINGDQPMTVPTGDRSNVAAPYIVGLVGTLRENSSTEKALRIALGAAEAAGARTLVLGGADIDLPAYVEASAGRSSAAQRLIVELCRADGVIIASPAYHGGISGLLKNALDYTEDMRHESAPYLEGRAVGCIVTAAGPQAMGTTLSALRDIVHSLRGWPTPLAVGITTLEPNFDAQDACISLRLHEQLVTLANQVVDFAVSHRAAKGRRAIGERERAFSGA
jgi:FMN reductase